MQRDGNQLGFTAPAMRADEEVPAPLRKQFLCPACYLNRLLSRAVSGLVFAVRAD